jgi:hypothetical protein
MADGLLTVLSGPVSGWPESSATPDGTRQRWATGLGANRRQWELQCRSSPP